MACGVCLQAYSTRTSTLLEDFYRIFTVFMYYRLVFYTVSPAWPATSLGGLSWVVTHDSKAVPTYACTAAAPSPLRPCFSIASLLHPPVLSDLHAGFSLCIFDYTPPRCSYLFPESSPLANHMSFLPRHLACPSVISSP